jgi:hypothetical protein
MSNRNIPTHVSRELIDTLFAPNDIVCSGVKPDCLSSELNPGIGNPDFCHVFVEIAQILPIIATITSFLA